MIFISVGLDAQFAAILEFSRVHEIMSIAGTEAYFARGASIGWIASVLLIDAGRSPSGPSRGMDSDGGGWRRVASHEGVGTSGGELIARDFD